MDGGLLTLYRRQLSKPSPRKGNARRQKWFSEEVLQTAEERREVKTKGESEIYTQQSAEFQRIANRQAGFLQ